VLAGRLLYGMWAVCHVVLLNRCSMALVTVGLTGSMPTTHWFISREYLPLSPLQKYTPCSGCVPLKMGFSASDKPLREAHGCLSKGLPPCSVVSTSSSSWSWLINYWPVCCFRLRGVLLCIRLYRCLLVYSYRKSDELYHSWKVQEVAPSSAFGGEAVYSVTK
jgi:hypothetical protein